MHYSATDYLFNEIVTALHPATVVIDRLRYKGYDKNFTFHLTDWLCLESLVNYTNHEIRIDEIYRFEDASGILNGIYIMAVRHRSKNIKGISMIDLPEGT
jgi:hypothetical protein